MLLDRYSTTEHALLDRSAAIHLADDALADGLPHSRDADHDRRPESIHIALTTPHGSISQRLHTPVTGGHANKHNDQLDDVLEHVCER